MRRIVPIGVLAALLTLPAAALAQQTSAAVATFSGRRARAVQRRVAREARDHFDVTPRARTRRASQRAGIEGTDAAGASELASSLGVDLVVQGQITGRGRRMRVSLVARAADGEELARAEIDFPRGRRARRAFDASVEQLFVEAAEALSRRAGPEEPEEPPPPVEPIEEEPPPEPPGEAPTDGLAWLAATVGVVGRTRDATVDLADGGRRGYASGLYPELLVAVELRPLANDPDLGRGLFFGGSFAHSVGLGSETETTMTAVDSTNFVRFDLDAGFLFPIEDAELGVGFGFGYDGYHLAANTVLPSAEYLYLRPHARARIRFVEETLVLGIEAAYRATLGRGALSDSFGADGDTHGVDVGVRLGGNLLAEADVGFTWGVGFEWVGYFLSFAGAAADSPGDSAIESAFRLRAELGWSFR